MTNNIVNTAQTTFWKFLKSNKIEIPIIQRDYAQGREDKQTTALRDKFLDDIQNALNKNKLLILDFVYGAKENEKLNPLDGQQRLTTLYLLHWYLASQQDNFKEDYSEILKKFSYETRISSREFCEQLSAFKYPGKELFEKKALSNIIIDEPWFYSFWKKDPTIQAMLTMLDAICSKFNTNINLYWETISRKECPIVFYYLNLKDLKDMKLTDELYVKMNARGKQLTSFENFKADLVGYIEIEKFESKDLPPDKKIAHKLDANWTDVFWQNNQDGKIDEIYYAFFNRYFLCQLITQKKITPEGKTEYQYNADKLEEEDSFNFLYGNKSDDSNIVYSNLKLYKTVLTRECLTNLEQIFSKELFNKETHYELNIKFADSLNPLWESKSEFNFIPKYNKKKTNQIFNSNEISISTITQPQRVLFFAICCYLKLEKFEVSNFKDWIRVVWNLVENANIDTIASMVGCIRLIDELSSHANTINKFLASNKSRIDSNYAKEQIAEERKKAKLLLGDNSEEWKNILLESEKFFLFTGAIRCLFSSSDIDYNENIEEYKSRWKNSQKYFNKSEVVISDDFSKDAVLMRSLISEFTSWEQIEKFIFDNNIDSWKEVVRRDILLPSIRKILLGIDKINLNKESELQGSVLQKGIHEELYQTTLLYSVSEKVNNARLKLRDSWSSYALYPPYCKTEENFFLVGNERNEILSSNSEIKTEQKCDNIPFFWGRDIKFKYKSRNFEWNTDGKIYLFDDKSQLRKKENPFKDITKENLYEKLDELIKSEFD